MDLAPRPALPLLDDGGQGATPIPTQATAHSVQRISFPAAYAVLVATSVLALALLDDAARTGTRGMATWFWISLLVMVIPAAVRLLGTNAGARERLGVLVLLGAGLYLAKVLHSPSEFTFSDELGTLRTTQDLNRTGHLLTANSIAKGFPLYPGVDLVVLALKQTSGLPLFTSALLVIGTVKLVLVVALFRLLELATRSARLAGIGVLIYLANPNFVFFDAQFAYESFALPLAIAALVLVGLALRDDDQRHRIALTGLGALVAVAVVPSHHITSYALAIILLLWTIALRGGRQRWGQWTIWPVLVVLVATVAAIGTWLLIVGGATSGYLRPVLGAAVESAYDFITGSSGGKAPFHAAGSPTNSLLEQVFGFGSVLVLLLLLGLGVWRLRKHRPPTALAAALTVIAMLYPVSLLLRLTQAGAETSNRASEFLFVGLAVVAGGVLASLASRGDGSASARSHVLVGIVVGLVFAGGIVVGWPPSSRLPGPPLVEADPRSVESYGLAAARWAATHLPHGSRIVADRANALLMSAYGGVDPQIGAVDRLAVAALITSPRFDTTERRIVALGHIAYIVVDRRLTAELPAFGVYVDHDEPDAYNHHRPLPLAAITKFATQPGLVRIYDNGAVSIYRVVSPSAAAL
jgi:hypothetical protein